MVDGNFLIYLHNRTQVLRMCGFHKMIARELHRLESGEIKRLAVFLPPRFGKSMMATFFAAWYLERNVSDDVIYAAYSQERAFDEMKTVVALNESLVMDDSKSCLETKDGGSFFPLTIRGFAGNRCADLIIMDDLIKDMADAHDQDSIKKRENWFLSSLYTRLSPDGKLLLIGSKWADDDINSFILRTTEEDDWTILKFPAIVNNKSIFEGSFPLKRLYAIRNNIGKDYWRYLYQQGVPASKSNKVLNVDSELHFALKKLAAENGISLQSLTERALKILVEESFYNDVYGNTNDK